MRKIILYFNNLKLKNKLTILFLFVSLIPTFIVGFFSFNVSSNVVKERKINETIYKLKTINEKVVGFIKEKELISIRVTLDDNLQSILISEDEVDSDEFIKRTFNLKKMLYDYKYVEDNHSIYIFDNNGRTYTNDNYPIDIYEYIKNQPWYKENINACKNYFWGDVQEFGNNKILPLIRIVKDKKNAKPIGMIMLNLKEKGISNIYKDSINDIADYIVILNENNNVISSDDKRFIGKNAYEVFGKNVDFSNNTGYFYGRIHSKEHMYIYILDNNTGWKYVGIISLDKIIASANYIKKMTIFVFILCIIICFLFSIFISKMITKPINKLISIIDSTENGNLDMDFNPRYGDEIGTLAISYKNMVIRLKKYIEDIYEIQNKKREAEYRALKYQINPHFLYNTLSSIIWLTSKGDKENVINLVTALSSLFRLSISKDKELITISEEIEHVKNYLRIQKIRYEDQFQCIFDFDLEVLNCYIIKIILQPLVENAIYHGIRDNDISGIIKIKGKIMDDKIVIEVIDNGNGMTHEDIDYINNFLEKGGDENNFGIGIRNVNDRISFYFKNAYGLRFQKQGIYTIARVTLPIIKEVKDGCIIF